MYNGLSYEVELQAQRSVKPATQVEMKHIYGSANHQSKSFMYTLVVKTVNAVKAMRHKPQPANRGSVQPVLGAK